MRKSEATTREETRDRAQVSYKAFRAGFGSNHPPEWPDLTPWMRDAIHVAYLQGSLDKTVGPGVTDDMIRRACNTYGSSASTCEWEWMREALTAALCGSGKG